MSEQEFIKKAENSGIDQIQITRITTEEDQVQYINEKREKYEVSNITSYLIKAEKDKKTVKMKGEYLDESIINTILMKLQYIESKNEDSYLENTEDNNQKKIKKTFDMGVIFPKIEKAIKEKKKSNITKIEINYVKRYKEIQIINNNGVNRNTSTDNYILVIEVVAHKDDKDAVARKTINQKDYDFDFEKILDEEIKEAQYRLEEKILKTGKYRVLIQNKVAGRLLSSIMAGLNANEIQKKNSIFQDKLNQNIATPLLNIIEDPTDIEYPGYALFDMEGTKTKRKEVIKDGILKTYFYNNKTAQKDNVVSTANEYGGINTSNLYIIPGEKNQEELIKELSNGVVVTNFMCGGDSISIEKGNISLQIFGYLVEDGKIKCGIKPAILTTTFDEVLNKLQGIGNDLLFSMPQVGSPSLLFDNLSIASDK